MHAIIVASIFVVSITSLPCCDSHILHHLGEGNLQGKAQSFLLYRIIAAAIQNYINSLVANGYDPYEPEGPQEIDFQLSDGTYSVHGVMDKIRVVGLSNIITNRLTSRLIPPHVLFDFELPQVQVWTESANITADFANYNLTADGVDGWVSVENTRIAGRADLRLGVPIIVTNVNSVVTFGEIQANVTGTLGGLNGSANLNGFINTNLPQFLSDNSAEVNRISGEVLKEQFNIVLASS